MFVRAVASLLALIAVTAPALAQGKLQWKFKEGEKLSLEEKIVAKSTTTFGGQKTSSEESQTRLSLLVVKKVGDVVELEQRIESWKMQSVGPYAGAEAGAKLLEEIAKETTFGIQVKLSGEVVAFKGAAEFLQKLAARDKTEAARFEEIGGKEILRSMIAMVFDVLPVPQAKKADTWKKETLVPMGPLGDFKYTMVFADPGKGDIGIKGTIAFQPAKTDPTNVTFKIVKMDLAGEIGGTMVFDATKGRLVRCEWTAPRTGTITVERQGEQSTLIVDGTETRTIRLLEKRP